MNLLFINHGYKPAYRIGGPIIIVSELAERLVRRGHRVTVFTTNSNLDEDLDVPTDRPIDVDGVEVWYFRRVEPLKKYLPFIPYLSRSIGYLYAPAMAGQLERLMPTFDLVHTHLPFVYPTAAAARAAKRQGTPLFYNQQGVLDPSRLEFRSFKKRLYLNAVEVPILHQATTLLALTQAEVQSFRALGVRTPIRVIPNGLDASLYRARPRSAGPLPLKAPGKAGGRSVIPPEAKVVLFLGRIHPIKGADKLLEAFLRIADRFPDSLLTLAGPDEFGLEERFRSRVASAGLEERVLFPGMMSGEEKIDLLARADLFVLPSDAEGFSMAVLEAMASETAVLLSPGCNFPEAEAAGAGRIAPADVPALETEMSGLLSDPERLKAMGRAGRRLVEERYAWERIVDDLVDAYEEGIRRSKRLKM